MSKIIFITGGVVSSLGKGIVAASIGNILKFEGFSVNNKKLDPYLNVDPGTINPIQHGEVYVTDDGAETDLDLGHYERFTGNKCSKDSNVTSGKIYQTLINKERNGEYLGNTVQVVPHVTDIIKNFILKDCEKYDFTICEIGGTIGDIEGMAFLEAIRQVRCELDKARTMSIHVTLLPYITASNELKTKPTQNSVKELMSYGIMADAIVCRTSIPISQQDKNKIGLFCNIPSSNVIEAPDVKNIYEIPIIYKQNGIIDVVFKHFNTSVNRNLFEENSKEWVDFVQKMNNLNKTINVAIAGKYTASKDAYKSIFESLIHAGVDVGVRVNVEMIDTRKINKKDDLMALNLAEFDGIIIPGGFGDDGVVGKMEVIRYCRESNIPLLGICYGMQLSVIEFARNVCKLDVSSAEFNHFETIGNSDGFIVKTMESWHEDNGKISHKQDQIGGSMRLGLYNCSILPNTKAFNAYKTDSIKEKHRHRYEIDIKYKDILEKSGAIFSGLSPDGKLPEIFEIPALKFFVTCQYHPELNSTPLKPNKLFISFVKACHDKG